MESGSSGTQKAQEWGGKGLGNVLGFGTQRLGSEEGHRKAPCWLAPPSCCWRMHPGATVNDK